MDRPRPDPSAPGAEYAKRVREELRTRCLHLKTKASFLGLPTDQHVENEFDTAVWWCQRTCAALGPDGSTASPRRCGGPGRTCYEGPPRL